ncbi:MAG: zinc ribbon domain-containing protein [Clostridiales bacterium]|nr:zinc ribbon domain-containing protein [Clostridiales bacterium]
MKKCSNCGYENPDVAKFCNECGKKLEEPRNIIEENPNSAIDNRNTQEVNISDNIEITEFFEPNESPIIDVNSKKKIGFTVKKGIVLAVCVLALGSVIFGGLKIKQYYDNVNAANTVINMINDIGEVTASPESADKIYNASQAYNALTDTQKSYVSNIDTLTNANKTYETKKSSLNMIVLATALKSNAELCQAFFSDYSSVWYNAIWRKTDKYNNGDFSDFNNALKAFQSSDTYTNAQKTLSTINKTILNTWKEIKDAPIEDAETYQALKDVYTAYQPMYTLAISPQGSYNSYTAEVQRLNSNYKTAYAALTAVMPSLETVNNN